jgi:hypothetical protein
MSSTSPNAPMAQRTPGLPTAGSFRHLERMTDDTGLLEHSLGWVPRRNEGYTTDDNARALWACVEWLELVSGDPERQTLLERLADRYLAFLLWARKDGGTFHNNFTYSRLPEEEEPSDDCHGRVLWALAVALGRWPNDRRGLAAAALLAEALPVAESLRYPRGQAYALMACCRLLEMLEPHHRTERQTELSGAASRLLPPAAQLEQWARQLETRLTEAYRRQADDRWRWIEPVMTYGNGIIPAGLLAAHLRFGRRETGIIARDMLDFLIEKMTVPEGWIRPIGNQGWCTREQCSQWDQQPLETMKLALACLFAHRAFGASEYAAVVRKCRDWFHGRNDAGVPLADEEGGCCDGLTADGPNFNRGAESTLSYLLTEAMALRLERETGDFPIAAGEADIGDAGTARPVGSRA